MTTRQLAHRLVRTLRAGTRGLVLVAADERRAVDLLESVAETLQWPLHTWSATAGTDGEGRPHDLGGLLTRLRNDRSEGLFVLLDAAPSLAPPAMLRAVRELAQRDHGPAVVLVDPNGSFGGLSLLERVPELSVHTVPPPDLDELAAHVAFVAGVLEQSGFPDAKERLRPAEAALARACLGLELAEVERLLAEAVLDHGADPEALLRFVGRHKPSALDRDGLLTPVDPVPEEQVGGLPAFKAWLRRRALALRPEARAAGIPDPKGVLLLGVQGCGKSLAARACASMLDLPLLRLDAGRLFGSTVGQSEANLRRALQAAERIAPVVLWLDEVDKGLAGSEGSQSDAGTTARVVASLLTWLQERQRPVFVVATANRIDTLPPELLRRGRLDETFFVDLPDADTREAIARVHLECVPLQRTGAIPPCADPWPAFASVARAAEGLNGAEIEAALVEARLDAFAEGRPLAAADFERAVAATVPLSVSRSESIDALRSWARTRARLA